MIIATTTAQISGPTFFANISDDTNDNVNSVNFTIINSAGTKVVNNLNGYNNENDQNWNVSYNLSTYGTWYWNISVFDDDGNIINSSTGVITLMEVSINLNNTKP